MWFIEKLWNSPLGGPILMVVIAMVLLFLIFVCTVLNVPGFKPKLDFRKDQQIRAIPPTASYSAPITREGDVVRTTSLPRRGARELEGYDDDRY